VHKLTIEVDTRQSFRSGFGQRPSGKYGTLTKEDRDWLFGSSRPRPGPPQTNLTDHAMGWLAQMAALKYLVIADCPNVTSEGIRRLAKSTSLVSVSIPDNPQCSDESLQLLASRVKDLYIIEPDGSSRRFDPDKCTSIGASELFNESGVQK
jgi:hypothetical protein